MHTVYWVFALIGFASALKLVSECIGEVFGYDVVPTRWWCPVKFVKKEKKQ